MLCLKHLKTIIVAKISECFQTSSGLSQKTNHFFCTNREEKPQDNRISLTPCERWVLSKVMRSSPRHTQLHTWRSFPKPQVRADNTRVSSYGHSQQLVRGEGGLRGPGEATYIKFFVLGDDFCVGNDGRGLTSEELVGWKKKERVADVKLGVKAATAVLVLSTTDIRANPPSPQAEEIGTSATSPFPFQTLQRRLQVFLPQSSFLQFLTPNRKQIFVSPWRCTCLDSVSPFGWRLKDDWWMRTWGNVTSTFCDTKRDDLGDLSGIRSITEEGEPQPAPAPSRLQ